MLFLLQLAHFGDFIRTYMCCRVPIQLPLGLSSSPMTTAPPPLDDKFENMSYEQQVELGSPEPGDDTKVTILGGDGQPLIWKVR